MKNRKKKRKRQRRNDDLAFGIEEMEARVTPATILPMPVVAESPLYVETSAADRHSLVNDDTIDLSAWLTPNDDIIAMSTEDDVPGGDDDDDEGGNGDTGGSGGTGG